MITHPPGHPTGPTGPGRDDAEQVLAAAGGHDGVGEPHEHSAPEPYYRGGPICYCPVEVDTHAPGCPTNYPSTSLPTFGMKVRNAERLLRQVLAVLERPVDPASEPTVRAEPLDERSQLAHDVLFAAAAVAVKKALRKVQVAGDLPSPPVGSAVAVSFPGNGGIDVLKLAELIRAAKLGGAL